MRALKIVGVTVASFLGVILAALVALRLLVDPNHYKGRIERSVRDATGRELTLQGPIKLSVFPRIAFELGPASLGNAQSFGPEPFAFLRHAALAVKLLPLLHRHVEFRSIELDGLELHLARNARGEGNWQLADAQRGGAATSRPAAPPGGLRLPAIAALSIRDARVTYQNVVADHLHASVRDLGSGAPVPITVEFELTQAPGAHPIELSGSFALVFGSKGLRIESLEAHVDDSILRGKIALADPRTGKMSFALAIDQIDMDRYLKAPDTGSPPGPAPVATAAEPLPTATLRDLGIDGSLAIGHTKVEGMTLSDVRVGITSGNGLIKFAPIEARLYGGQYSGELTFDVRGPVPDLATDQSLAAVDVAQLLKDAAHTERLSGLASIAAHLTARGATGSEVLRSLGGHVVTTVTNGAIEGIDFRSEIDGAMALIGAQGLRGGSPVSIGRTRFKTFTCSADLLDGVAVTHDLDLESPHLSVTGAGSANLVTGAIAYKVQAAILRGSPAPGGETASALMALPFDVTGTLANPKVRPDVQAIVTALPVRRLEKQEGTLQQKLLDKLRGIFK